MSVGIMSNETYLRVIEIFILKQETRDRCPGSKHEDLQATKGETGQITDGCSPVK